MHKVIRQSRALLVKHLLIACVLLTLSHGVLATSADLSAEIRENINATLDELETTGDYTKAQESLQAQFDRVITHASIDEADLFREAAFALRLVSQLGAAEESVSNELLGFLLDNTELASTLAFLVKPEQEDPALIYALLDEMRLSRASKIVQYTNLAAAICVVHEKPFSQRVNENFASSASAIEIFDCK